MGVACLALFASSCAEEQAAPESEVVVGSGDARYPYDTVSDWKSYADAVAVVTVESVKVMPLDAEDAKFGSGLQERRITVSVDELLWKYPKAPSPGKSIQFVGLPYVVRDGKVLESRMGIAPWMNVGEQFLVPLLRPTGEDWIPINVEAAIAVEAGSVSAANNDSGPPFMARLAGLSLDAASKAISAAAADPVAESNRQLGPDERYLAVVAATDLPESSGDATNTSD